ncbi:MAG: AAA family ATPase [Patescibacteria group bacterium]|nr:AAA family ATPase [Patescibacteria group bacterium]
MKRNIYKDLLDWKIKRDRQPLLVRGARQVGKTFIINEFGKNEFESLVTLNFERNPEYKEIFTKYSPIEILEKVALYTGKNIIENEILLFLDEIQECPKAITSLRYFYEEMPNLHVIGAGSLLEFALESENFRMPVGRVEYLFMYPLSFGEFLVALGEKPLLDFISEKVNFTNLTDLLHEKLIEYIRKYFIIGGMPAIVKEYITSHNILNCQKKQKIIINTFQDDFAKYARHSKFKYLKKVFNAVPVMIGNKFIYSKVDSSAKSRDIKSALELLETANIIYKVKRTSGAGLPLKAGVNEKFFKVIFLDVGLMHAINDIYSETIKEKDLTTIYKGSVAEQFAGQELIACQQNFTKTQLYYWAKEAKNSSAELDYLIEKNEEIIPIEIKSGSSGKMRSMNMFLKKYKMQTGVKISQAKFSDKNKIKSIPFYGIEILS